MAAATPDNSFYRPVGGDGRHIGVAGDISGFLAGTAGVSLALLVEGKVVATTRSYIVKAVTSLSAAGAVTLTGAVNGDKVLSVTDLSSDSDVSSSFESTISVANQIQQTASTSGHQVLVVVQPQS